MTSGRKAEKRIRRKGKCNKPEAVESNKKTKKTRKNIEAK